jgi:hypothetical protein
MNGFKKKFGVGFMVKRQPEKGELSLLCAQ